MTKFLKSVLEERRAASLKLRESLDACEKVDIAKDSVPVPRRGKKGNDILGPQNPDRMRQEPDTVCTGKEGVEFLLIFDNGNFSEDSTFLLTDYIARTPKSILAKNFRVDEAIFDSLSEKEKYIFQGSIPGSLSSDRKSVGTPSKHRFTHRMLAQTLKKFPGGEVRITDTSNFPISKTTASAHVIINPGCLREMHWHPNADEWSFFLRGHARITIFAASGNARTFNYQAGDVGIVPKNNAHYVENIGTEPVEMLEMFRADKFEDFSTEQWLAQTPATTVAEHLNLVGGNREKFLKSLSKDKTAVKAPVRKTRSTSDMQRLLEEML
ncbi:oxalate decarboxylase family bicupin [Aureobasidium sp. EXF-12298]|nr:oxalate decarboxylase family bicupin [Aureobasidium sp. EXF-12298]